VGCGKQGLGLRYVGFATLRNDECGAVGDKGVLLDGLVIFDEMEYLAGIGPGKQGVIG